MMRSDDTRVPRRWRIRTCPAADCIALFMRWYLSVQAIALRRPLTCWRRTRSPAGTGRPFCAGEPGESAMECAADIAIMIRLAVWGVARARGPVTAMVPAPPHGHLFPAGVEARTRRTNRSRGRRQNGEAWRRPGLVSEVPAIWSPLDGDSDGEPAAASKRASDWGFE